MNKTLSMFTCTFIIQCYSDSIWLQKSLNLAWIVALRFKGTFIIFRNAAFLRSTLYDKLHVYGTLRYKVLNMLSTVWYTLVSVRFLPLIPCDVEVLLEATTENTS